MRFLHYDVYFCNIIFGTNEFLIFYASKYEKEDHKLMAYSSRSFVFKRYHKWTDGQVHGSYSNGDAAQHRDQHNSLNTTCEVAIVSLYRLVGTSDTLSLVTGRSETLWVYNSGKVSRLSSLHVKTFCFLEMARFAPYIFI